MQNVEREFKHTLAIPLREKGNRSGEARIGEPQFPSSCRNCAKSDRQAESAATGFFERSQCAKYCKVIDASQQGSSLRYGLHILASKFECSQELSTGLQLGREPVPRQPLPQHGSSAGKPHMWQRTGDLGRKLPTNPLRSRRI